MTHPTMGGIGRATQGVRLIKLDEGDKVVAVARLVPEEDNGEKGEGAEGVVDSPGEQDIAPNDGPEVTDDGAESIDKNDN